MTDKQKEAYNIMATQMDTTHAYKVKLLNFYKKHKYVPDEHKEAFEAFKKDRFKSWRTMPKVYKRVVKAAKKAAKAKGLEKLKEEARNDRT